jgi:Bacterial extracellular solute-binding protein
MNPSNLFKTIIISISVLIGLLAILIFSGKFPGIENNSAKVDTNKPTMLVWGTISASDFQAAQLAYTSAGNLPFGVNYVYKDKYTLAKDLVNRSAVGGGPDLVIAPHSTLLTYSGLLYTIPYTYMTELDYKNIFVDATHIFNTPYGSSLYPVLIDPMITIYNKKLLADNGFTNPPKTWIELPKYQSKITKYDASGKPITSAFGIGANNISNNKDILTSQIMQLGVVPVKAYYNSSIDGTPKLDYIINLANTSSDFDSDYTDLVKILRYQLAFSDPQKSTFTWDETSIDDMSKFISGQSALYFGKASDIDRIKRAAPSLDIGLYYLPQLGDGKRETMSGDSIGVGIGKNNIDFKTAVDAAQVISGLNFSTILSRITGMAGARKDVLYGADGSERSEVVGRSALVMQLLYNNNEDAINSAIFKLYDNALSSRRTAVEASNDFEYDINKIFNKIIE